MSTHVTLTLAEFAPWLRSLGPKIEKAAVRGMRDAGQVLKRETLNQITETKVDGKSRAPVDTGVYRAAWRVSPLSDGCRVSNDTAYAAMIELGRAPGPVSAAGYRALVDWVRRKRLYLDELAAMQGKASRVSIADDGTVKHGAKNPRGMRKKVAHKDAVEIACERVAYAIKNKIEEHGYKPRHVFARALEAAKSDMRDAVRARLDEVGT